MSPRTRSIVLAIAAGLALADASIVTLALPEVLVQLDTSVEGVAAVIGVYALVLAVALVPVERLQRTHGAPLVGAAGMALFGLASLLCGVAGSVVLLLVGRALQAVGGAATLIAVFALLEDGHGADRAHAKRLWLGAAVLSAAVGPALGGALTQAFDWRAIFLFQTPVALAAAWVCRTTPTRDPAVLAADDDAPGPRWAAQPTVALALVSAALTAVLFLLVLLLVAGWSVDPLRAALTVSVLPAAALVGSRIGGDATHRAAAGSLLIGAGTLALAFLPDDRLLWTVAPQVLAGLGMGLALPALGGELLPERTGRDAAWLLTTRHVGIFAIIAVLGSITATRLEDATQRARERGVAVALDARLPPQQKVSLAPALLGSVDAADPRGALLEALDRERASLDPEDLPEYDRMASRVDETLIAAVGESFDVAFLVTGGLAVLAALVLAPKAPPPSVRTGALLGVTLVVTAAAPALYAREQDDRRPTPIALLDPCTAERQLPGSGGLSGFVQDRALEALDTSACELGSSREELVLALADPQDADRFEERYGRRPSAGNIITSLLFGG
ncbi:MFS transporter [Conexibacter sp. W3-3-2]|uniref:MFS transporter n=1 Tax=Paraconexibacter algicola TaxID=2133960 RepID=A0A2T4ULN7_9ACTN|nr:MULTISPECIES: MFS transporter [Solirubrobacterales]MTD46473.1 MFS transporter [Conexibacter sp. W3-3-2]PTL60124.1 MFS transporter [Paraconexibacter algicola]